MFNLKFQKLFQFYEDCKKVNVKGVIELIKLSLSSFTLKNILIVNFSSFSVFYNQELNENFNESILPSIDNINNLPTGYMKSKIPPGIFLNPETGIGHKSDFTLLFLQCCYELGCHPSKVGDFILFNPITWVANNITKIIMNDQCWNNNNNDNDNNSSLMNIYNVHGDPIPSDSFLVPLENNNFNCKIIPLNEWVKLVENSNQSGIKLRSFHSLDLLKFKSNKHSVQENQKISSTKSFFQSMGSFENHLKITVQMIINHINFNFNLNKKIKI
ncbi:hypothetical protein ACTFIY_011276 [Dictyostelium cf. discoideum]